MKILAHETTMEIPIANTLNNVFKNINFDYKKLSMLNLKNLNNLELSKIKENKFPLIKILKTLPKKDSLFETLLVAANDEFVNLFLKKKISYSDLLNKLVKFVTKKEFTKYKRIEPKNIIDILNLNQIIRSKINS